eukprot:scaffold25412_cov64-Phaeocystis_antarctica.AAC.2
MRSFSSSAASTATVGAGLGAFTRCCVYRASVTEEQCSSSSIESDTIATVDSCGIDAVNACPSTLLLVTVEGVITIRNGA